MQTFIHSKYLHISIDDVIEILRELEQQKHKSVWDHPVFSFFKELNEQYGAVFSLYCFYFSYDGRWNLDQMPDHFKAEFEQSSKWMRFGFHSYHHESKYGLSNKNLSAQEAFKHYSLITESICRFAGTQAIDTVPRIHFYLGTREKIKVWRDAKNGIEGLLTADDDRNEVYYLDEIQRENLMRKGHLFDSVESLYFIKTNLRLENESAPVEKLEARKNGYQEQGHFQCIFTHEEKLNSRIIKKRIEDCCEWASLNGYEFLFPMDALPKCQKGELYASASRNPKIPGSSTNAGS
ncbi:hypothetical protein [Planococcus chinensis]|uniref:Polysaccharide deacetylase n=1 Tax=Planococcus chinensis TaxID=272917 RepID=A0ABW4QD64_9BACL